VSDETVLHPDHTGKSLSSLAYRHISNQGHILMSSNVQSHSGAKLWRGMMRDPKLKKRMFQVNDGKLFSLSRNPWRNETPRKNRSRIVLMPPNTS